MKSPVQFLIVPLTAFALLGAGATALAESAGVLDPTFGDQGVVSLPGTPNQLDVATTGDGKTVALLDDRVIRLLADGKPDPSFGTDGTAPIPDGPGGISYANSLKVDTDGSVLVTGQNINAGETDVNAKMGLLRLTSGGVPDPTFGAGGVVAVDVGPEVESTESAGSVTLDADGKYVVAGHTLIGGDLRYTVLRLNRTGTLDSSFDGDGKLVLPALGTYGYGLQASMDGDKIVVVDFDTTAGTSFVTRVTDSGALDGTFGTAGTATLTNTLGAGHLVVLPDHRLRYASLDPSKTATLDGLTATGQPDTAVGAAGRRTYAVTPGGVTRFSSLATLGQNTLVVVGLTGEANSTTRTSILGRLTVDGAPDTTFADNGFATGPTVAGESGYISAVAIDGAGRAVTAGGTKSTVRISRYLAKAGTTGTGTGAVTPPVTTTPITTVPPQAKPSPSAPKAKAKSKPKAASVLRLPSSKRCVAGSSVSLRVVAPKGLKIKQLKVKIGKAKSKSAKSGARLRIKGNPKSKVRIIVRVTLSDGTVLKRTLTYRRCAAKAGARR